MLLRIGLYAIPALLFILWGYLAVTDIKKHSALRKKYQLKFFWGLPHLKQMVDKRHDEDLKREYMDLKSWTKKRIGIWIFSIIMSAMILIILGLLSATTN